MATPELLTQKRPPSQSDEELKLQKRIKLFTYVHWYFHYLSNHSDDGSCLLGLTVMKVKTPKARLGEIEVETLNSVPATPSLDTTSEPEIKIKNTNWGPYKFDAGTARFMYKSVTIGKVDIPKSKAGMLSTKKLNVEVSLNTSGLNLLGGNLGSELSSGVLTLTSQVQLKGKVELMLIMKKHKNASMDCTIAFDFASKKVKSLECK